MSKRKIRVLHVISNFGVGGAETWIIAILRYFKEFADSLDVTIESDVFLTHGIRDRLDQDAEELGANLYYSKYSRTTLIPFIHDWRRILSSGQYDAVHDHQEFSAGWHFLFGTGLLPKVRITSLHNPMSHQKSYGRGIMRRQAINIGNQLVALYSTHLLSTSKQLISDQGFDTIRLAKKLPKIALHCGFDPRRFFSDRTDARNEIINEFNLASNAQIMLFVGRLDSNTNPALNQKNPAFCLDVAMECARRNPTFVCLIAGGGDAVKKELESKVQAMGRERQIQFLGSRTDIPRLMKGADLLLLPSIAEGLGMVAVEAQAAGLPVIASTAVPRECCVVDSMVQFLNLSDGVDNWSNRVLETLISPKPNHVFANGLVDRSPFSICRSASALAAIYNSQSVTGVSP
jgi:glycosyltransferase EpsF